MQKVYPFTQHLLESSGYTLMNGFKTVEILRNTTNLCQKSIIIALTANASSEDKHKAINSGMNDILIKPFSEEQMIRTTNQWVEPVANINISNNQENEQNFSNEIYDKQSAITLAGGNQQLAEELLNMLVTELPQHKSNIEQAYKNMDFDELRNCVHKLHGGAKYCAANELTKSTGKLENLVIENKTRDD